MVLLLACWKFVRFQRHTLKASQQKARVHWLLSSCRVRGYLSRVAAEHLAAWTIHLRIMCLCTLPSLITVTYRLQKLFQVKHGWRKRRAHARTSVSIVCCGVQCRPAAMTSEQLTPAGLLANASLRWCRGATASWLSCLTKTSYLIRILEYFMFAYFAFLASIKINSLSHFHFSHVFAVDNCWMLPFRGRYWDFILWVRGFYILRLNLHLYNNHMEIDKETQQPAF